MFGFRPEGRRVKKMDPIVQITPYLMPQRCDAQVFLDYDVEYDPLMRYIAQKSREGCKITFMEIMIASYIRAVSQVPEINRFIINKQIYNRKELTVSFNVLLDTEDDSIKETAVKVFFDPSDTIFDVSARMKDVIARNRKEESADFTLKLASFLMKVPLLPGIVVGLVKFLDRYGLCPKALLDSLPFHTSMYITNNASIGLMRVYHHIYNFGNTSLFFGMGVPKRFNTVDAKGNVIRKCQLPIGITADERVCSGAVYAKFFAVMKQCLVHPEQLENPPEKVFFNDGVEFHAPKPQNAFAPAKAQAESIKA
ncbi:MAG: 2-oxo acid dehydrogenase subunit E2 [Clostridia bacterium]|nr:2-oxo acid dehydrogenase subunit E2 [Clostridia bacterium]